MHHTLALAWPRSQAAKPANSVPTLQMQDEGVLAATPGRYPQSFVFGFGANRKGQCGVRHQAQQGSVAGNVWEPSVVSGISAGQQIVEVKPFLWPTFVFVLLIRATGAEHSCVA